MGINKYKLTLLIQKCAQIILFFRRERNGARAGFPEGAGLGPPEASPDPVLGGTALPAGAGVPAEPVPSRPRENRPGRQTWALRNTGEHFCDTCTASELNQKLSIPTPGALRDSGWYFYDICFLW